jgi:phosphoribosylanthranilate isomerase
MPERTNKRSVTHSLHEGDPIGRGKTEPSWPPRIQVAGVSSLEEALFCADAGVDSLGLTLELPTGVHDNLTNEKAREIIAHVPDHLITVVITYLTSATEASRLVKRVRANAVQFHGGISEPELRVFRSWNPGVRTIAPVTVRGPEARNIAERFKPPLWDAIILDSYDPLTRATGATGLTHDWRISAEIARRSHIPVILAGGLSPENVADAIRTVRPDGVDAHTGLEDPDGTRNMEKIGRFAAAARDAFPDHPRPVRDLPGR